MRYLFFALFICPTLVFGQNLSIEEERFKVDGKSYYKDEVGLRTYIDEQERSNPALHKKLDLSFRKSTEEADAVANKWQTRMWIAFGVAVPTLALGINESFKRNDDLNSSSFFEKTGNPTPYLIGAGVATLIGIYCLVQKNNSTLNVDDFLKKNLSKPQVKKDIFVKKIKGHTVPVAQLTFSF